MASTAPRWESSFLRQSMPPENCREGVRGSSEGSEYAKAICNESTSTVNFDPAHIITSLHSRYIYIYCYIYIDYIYIDHNVRHCCHTFESHSLRALMFMKVELVDLLGGGRTASYSHRTTRPMPSFSCHRMYLVRTAMTGRRLQHSTCTCMITGIIYMYMSWVRVPPEAAHISLESDCLGCAVLLCLIVCLTLLASFFLPSLISHQNMYIHVYTCTLYIAIAKSVQLHILYMYKH